MATEEQNAKMRQFEQEHPDWDFYGFNQESAQYKKDGQFLFYDWENIHGPVTDKEIFFIGRAIYTKNTDDLTSEQKAFAKSNKNTILDWAESYGISQGNTSRETVENMLFHFMQIMRTPVNHDPARHDKDYKPMTYGQYKKQKDEAFKVQKGDATILDDLVTGKESEPIPPNEYNRCSCIPDR